MYVCMYICTYIDAAHNLLWVGTFLLLLNSQLCTHCYKLLDIAIHQKKLFCNKPVVLLYTLH